MITLDSPRLSRIISHLEVGLITSAKPLLTCKVTHSQASEVTMWTFGGHYSAYWASQVVQW